MGQEHAHPHIEDAREHAHGHAHVFTDPSIAATSRGLRALTYSFIGLMATAVLQLVVVVVSGSVALLADTIHNFADAATAIPLGVAFWLARRGATRRFTYGLGRAEDVAGLVIVATILLSAILAAVESIRRLLRPEPVEMLWAVAAASAIGFLGNEAVAIFRIRTGREIGSAALVADGYHARVDGWTSLAVLLGVAGVWAGYPVADPLVGLVIAAAILALVWRASREVLLRILDGVETATLSMISDAARKVGDVEAVPEVRARWIGHRLHADVSITVPATLSVAAGHAVAKEVRHQLLHRVPYLGSVHIHVDPSGEGGEAHHRIGAHAHDGLRLHSHD
jgi:cation diffusion facilitator family transporter